MRPRIVIVDDDPSFLATVRVVLEAEGLAVVGEAETGRHGIALALGLRPDLVLVDVNLPDVDGFEVVERIAGADGTPTVVLTSIRSESDFGNLIKSSRAKAFITKADITGEALTGLLERDGGAA